jgi:putative hydrolase of HD superfamily
MDIERFSKQMEFIVEIDKLKKVIRQSALTDGSRQENDSEHSWHIATMAILLSEYSNVPNLDLLKVLKMLLIHDLVEIYAGDTFAYDVIGNSHKTKREQEAAKKIFGLLPDDQKEELHTLWQEFENEESPEARFAAAIDKLQPLILSFSNKGWSWTKHGVAGSQVLDSKKTIELGSDVLWEYAKELVQKSIKNGFLEEE